MTSAQSIPVDKHIVKMPLEAAQMLCTNHWVDKYLGLFLVNLRKRNSPCYERRKQMNQRDFPYLPTMHNHPCDLWARIVITMSGCFVMPSHWTKNTITDTEKAINQCMMLYSKLPSIRTPSLGLTPFAQAMLDQLKGSDAIEAFVDFITKTKQRLHLGSIFREKPPVVERRRSRL